MKRLNTGRGYIFAEDVVDGVPINPKLPPDFDQTPLLKLIAGFFTDLPLYGR